MVNSGYPDQTAPHHNVRLQMSRDITIFFAYTILPLNINTWPIFKAILELSDKR